MRFPCAQHIHNYTCTCISGMLPCCSSLQSIEATAALDSCRSTAVVCSCSSVTDNLSENSYQPTESFSFQTKVECWAQGYLTVFEAELRCGQLTTSGTCDHIKNRRAAPIVPTKKLRLEQQAKVPYYNRISLRQKECLPLWQIMWSVPIISTLNKMSHWDSTEKVKGFPSSPSTAESLWAEQGLMHFLCIAGFNIRTKSRYDYR